MCFCTSVKIRLQAGPRNTEMFGRNKRRILPETGRIFCGDNENVEIKDPKQRYCAFLFASKGKEHMGGVIEGLLTEPRIRVRLEVDILNKPRKCQQST